MNEKGNKYKKKEPNTKDKKKGKKRYEKRK